TGSHGEFDRPDGALHHYHHLLPDGGDVLGHPRAGQGVVGTPRRHLDAPTRHARTRRGHRSGIAVANRTLAAGNRDVARRGSRPAAVAEVARGGRADLLRRRLLRPALVATGRPAASVALLLRGRTRGGLLGTRAAASGTPATVDRCDRARPLLRDRAA